MPVPGDSAVVVVDVDDLAEAAGVAGSGGGDAAICGCVDGGADGGGEVQAVVDTGREALGEAACGAGVGVGPGGAVRRCGGGCGGRCGCGGGGGCGSGSGSGLLGAAPPGAIPPGTAPPGAGPVTGSGLGDRLPGDGEGQGEDAHRSRSVQGPTADTRRCARETALVGVTAGRRPSGELVATEGGVGRGVVLAGRGRAQGVVVHSG